MSGDERYAMVFVFGQSLEITSIEEMRVGSTCFQGLSLDDATTCTIARTKTNVAKNLTNIFGN